MTAETKATRLPPTLEGLFDMAVGDAQRRVADDGKFGLPCVFAEAENGDGIYYALDMSGPRGTGPMVVAAMVWRDMRAKRCRRYTVVLEAWGSSSPLVDKRLIRPEDDPDRTDALTIGACEKDRVLFQGFTIEQRGASYVLVPLGELADTRVNARMSGRFYTLLSDRWDPIGRRITIGPEGEEQTDGRV
jgi:hypothetical protein